MFKLRNALLVIQVIGVLIAAWAAFIATFQPATLEANLDVPSRVYMEQVVEHLLENAKAPKDDTSLLERLTNQLNGTNKAVFAKAKANISGVLEQALYPSETADPDFDVVLTYTYEDQSLKQLIQKEYRRSLYKLLYDFRRMAMSSFVVLLMCLAVTIFKHVSNKRYFFFSAALTGYVGWSAHAYLYGQDRSQILLLSGWTADAHIVSMGIVSLVLLDLLILNGAIIKMILAAILEFFALILAIIGSISI